eukprot:CAMPEP_0201574744 /NCGR_PEP_ID=MMETSP0190_2-20130828/19436_1 /ASSEMBLY_ACC=CAM_ASM_000263 /TAXON_ID=37353 /ORGANISM="Rosalina sp." /LENGTH=377 /DNA_ID=CAMNT_0048003421 /DNA_START=22 /DNA_END=1155 /DNA_ORIENTATION=+
MALRLNHILCISLLLLYIILGISAKSIKTRRNNNNNGWIKPSSLCDCYTISLEQVSENNDVDLICYTYLIQHGNDNNNDKCEYTAKSIVFGVCDNNDYDLTEQILETSIINTNPEQQLFESYKSDSFLGLNIERFDNEKVIICMKDMEEISFTTSNNVQLILNNDDIITCPNNDKKLNGLPCFHANTHQPMKKSKDEKQPKDKDKDEKQKDDQEAVPMAIISPLNEDVLIENKGLSVTTRQYIRFIFVTILIIIILNAMCCVFLALRQSGALDKYFDEVSSDIDDDDGDIDEDFMDSHLIGEDIDDDHRDSDIDEDEDDECSPPIPQCSFQEDSDKYIVQDISFSDLVIMRNENDSENDNGSHDKFTISVAQSPYKE